MKRVIALSLIFSTAVLAGDGKHSWIRRVAAISVCAVSAADISTTSIGVRRGYTEENSLLSRGGKPRWGLMAGLNVGACAGAIIAAYKAPTPLASALSAGYVIPKGIAVEKNISALRQSK
jgi:hypothetical protein